ncbi:septal ring lytic transglycosylase RlpA family protein [Benzoatithermus flavus]|uniref:Endolytic peptidoglycan transglycosylase RlpA n=1 Tax=Benzoatithermus flavus TaxID=3108223 RepID=A0ABU8XL86_9PROT
MIAAPTDARSGLALALILLLAACSSTREASRGPSSSKAQGPIGTYKVGTPYQINGKWYYPEFDPSYERVGIASWYGDDFQGLPTANGEVFDKTQLTAAHTTLPLPSIVRVTNLDNGRSIDVRVNDRGPFVGDRLIDLSQAAARELGYESQGLARVRVKFLGLAEAKGPPPRPVMVAARSTPPATAPVAPSPPKRSEAPPREPVAPLTIPAGRPVQVAALMPPPSAAPGAACLAGDQFVQVGAFADTMRVRAAIEAVGKLRQPRVEPTFVAGKAMARVRLGPVNGGAEARRLLEQVRAMGYTGAFLTPAAQKAGAPVALTC